MRKMPSPKRTSGDHAAIVFVISASCSRGNRFAPRSARKNVARSSTVEMIPPSPLTGRPELHLAQPGRHPLCVRGAVARASEVEAADDSARDDLVEGSSGDLLDDQAEQHEVGVGVRARGAGREQTTPLSGDPLDPDQRRF